MEVVTVTRKGAVGKKEVATRDPVKEVAIREGSRDPGGGNCDPGGGSRT